MFLIPYNQLSDEQKGIVRRVSREQTNLFVEGPPGSGKTLISLYTLRDIVTNSAVRPLLLMYNHSLYGYLKTAMRELDISDNITIATKDKFFWDLARYHDIVPDYNQDYNLKYSFLLKGLLRVNLTREYDITVVDEVQDLRPEEWMLIKKLSRRITSLGDFDQKVFETPLTRNIVVDGGLKEGLSQIFRFHKNIAKIARLFSRTKDDLEKRVTKTSQKHPQIIYVSASEEFRKIAEILENLQSNRERIGLLCPDREILKGLSVALISMGIEHNYYASNQDLRNHDFSSTIPLLITSFSAKGLEFENVVLFGFNQNSKTISQLRAEGRLNDVIYVSITRTNSSLYIISTPDTIKEIRDIEVAEINSQPDITLDELF